MIKTGIFYKLLIESILWCVRVLFHFNAIDAARQIIPHNRHINKASLKVTASGAETHFKMPVTARRQPGYIAFDVFEHRSSS